MNNKDKVNKIMTSVYHQGETDGMVAMLRFVRKLGFINFEMMELLRDMAMEKGIRDMPEPEDYERYIEEATRMIMEL